MSLVGLVGAGKSVLANMLIVCLAKRGLRAVSLLNSVSDVMESVVLLREAGISASPLVSRGRRIERLDEFFDHDDSMLLDHSASKYLETACIMDGLSSSDPEACGYGSTPCRGLRSKKGGANSCPYWDVCPSQAMARESLTSDVVVTTPTGFATMIVGRERKAFFEEALQQFDVVLFDEADRVQAQLDGCFAPSMSFQELIRNAADPTAVAMKRRPDDKMRDFNEELFYDLRQKSEPVAKALLKSVRDDRVAKWRIVKDEAFTSLSLLNDLLEQGLPKQVYEDADKLINPYRFEIAKKSLDGGDAALNKLSQAVATSCEGIDDDTHSYSLNEYLAACGCSELPDELRTRFSFALKVIRFDSYLRELASAQDLLSFKDDSVDELYNFLKFSYTRQQHYLPNSLIGNIFGMKLDGNDLRLFRQFAFGRAFMCSLPWLDTDPAGAALGPHVLLLSGSSWEPGCLQYHVNRPVDYLLEAEPWKAAKLSTSTVRDLGIEQNVSGSAAEIRSGNLGIVLSQTMATLKDELDADGAGKALVIVNSYREAEDARERPHRARVPTQGPGNQGRGPGAQQPRPQGALRAPERSLQVLRPSGQSARGAGHGHRARLQYRRPRRPCRVHEPHLLGAADGHTARPRRAIPQTQRPHRKGGRRLPGQSRGVRDRGQGLRLAHMEDHGAGREPSHGRMEDHGQAIPRRRRDLHAHGHDHPDIRTPGEACR